MATRFDPEKHLGRAFNHDDAEVLAYHPVHSIVVAVDGTCRNNGRPNARAALGVFFRQDPQWNKSETLPAADATSQRAELCAALRALQTVRDVVAHERDSSTAPEFRLRRVILKSDSTYLVSAITEWIFGWFRNGFTTARRLHVLNQDLLKRLAGCIQYLEDIK